MDWQSIVYTIAISMVTGMVFGLVPALNAAHGNLQDSLKEGARGATGGRRAWTRNVLVVAEVSLALVLLVGASLFVRSFRNLQGANVGFDTAPLMTLRFYLTGEAYDPPDVKARRVEDIVRRVEALPGVQAAFASNFVPLSGGGGGGEVVIEGRPQNDPAGRQPSISRIAASPHLRQTLGLALVRGRDFTDAEGNSKAPVALINQTMATRFWGEVDPIGRRFHLTGGTRHRVVHRHWRAGGLPAFSGDRQQPCVPGGVCALPARTGAQYRSDDPGWRRSGAHHASRT